MEAKKLIEEGKSFLGIEFGSTRIKAVVIDEEGKPLASGSHEWENRFDNGIWTYTLEDIWGGLQDCYQDLLKDIDKTYGVSVSRFEGIGFSAMMHGYLAFDAKDELLVPFRTWRNTITEEAAEKLTKEFSFNIPQRWSIAHLYQAILNQEAHVKDIAFLTTLAGYVHYKLTGEKVLGVGDASGMFPIDSTTGTYDAGMVDKFDKLIASCGFSWKLTEILPGVLTAGEKVRTGNVSAGTSIFAMIVLEKALSSVYPQIDMVTTPDGAPVAMVHCNNCTSDINAWVNIFDEFAESIGHKVDKNTLYTTLFQKALEGDADCGGLVSYNYFSGEPP